MFSLLLSVALLTPAPPALPLWPIRGAVIVPATGEPEDRKKRRRKR